jgi:hypothetical protein
LVIGHWDLGFGIWDLGFGIWDLGFGIWDLGFGIWDLACASPFQHFSVSAFQLFPTPFPIRVHERAFAVKNLPLPLWDLVRLRRMGFGIFASPLPSSASQTCLASLTLLPSV